MKIERVSDTQIKFFLNQSDLSERNIKFNELAYGTEKTQALFREMMEQAMIEFDFNTNNTSLMIEAIPVSSDTIVISVTKVGEAEEGLNKINILPQGKDVKRFKSKDYIETPTISDEDNISIFSFGNLDEAAEACVRIRGFFLGTSSMYKMQSMYFLVLQSDARNDKLASEALEATLKEYGQKHVSTAVSKYFLVEHAEVVIKDAAVDILCEYL